MQQSSSFSQTDDSQPQTSYIRGVMWFILTGLLSICVNSLMRVLSESCGYHPLQLVLFYSVAGLLPYVPSIIRNPARYKIDRPRLYVTRGVLEVVGFGLVFYSLLLLPFAMFTVLTFTTPIIASFIAVKMLGETMTGGKWLSLIIGFSGIIVVSNPSEMLATMQFNWAILLPLAASTCFAVCIVCIRKLARTDPPSRIASMTLSIMAIMSLPMALYHWQTPSIDHLPYLLLLAGLVSAVQFCVGKALHHIELTAAQPYMFLSLIWSSLIGYYLFGEDLSVHSFAGAALIIIAIIIGIKRRVVRPSPHIVKYWRGHTPPQE